MLFLPGPEIFRFLCDGEVELDPAAVLVVLRDASEPLVCRHAVVTSGSILQTPVNHADMRPTEFGRYGKQPNAYNKNDTHQNGSPA